MIRKALPALTLAVSIAILIVAKTFLYPDCFSFDSHDDANHAFPNLQIARDAISSGQLPTINWFNNFGAPLLGDALTYPYAIQSLTYYFFEGPVAMTINRFMITILTVLLGYLFFRLYLGRKASLVCAALTFFNPVAFWYPVHQYQMATPFFFATLLQLDHLAKTRSRSAFFLLFGIVSLTFLSVSINHVIMMVPFFITWNFCRNGFRLDRTFFTPLVALLCGLIFTYPQTLAFARSYATSARAGEGVYSGILTTAWEFLLGVLIPPGEWIAYNYGAQLQVTSYISLPIILSICCGIYLVRGTPVWKQASLILCGIIPTVIALFLYVNTELRFSIPLVKSVDISRVLWFSFPFLIVYTGHFLERVNARFLGKWLALPIALGSIAAILIFMTAPETANIAPVHYLILFLFAAGTSLSFFSKTNTRLQRTSGWMILCSVALTPVPVIIPVLGLNLKSCVGTQYADHHAASDFKPVSLVALMEKGSRLATEVHTHKGHDLRIARHGIFGSSARAIVVNKKFGRWLEANKLVTVDQIPYGYFFSPPWRSEYLNHLGIRYVLVPRAHDVELENQSWTKLGEAQNLSLYENPVPATPAYLSKDGFSPSHFVPGLKVSGQRLEIELPKIDEEIRLVITTIADPALTITSDGRTIEAGTTESGLLSVKVGPKDHVIVVQHRPYAWRHVLGGMLLAVLFAMTFSYYLKKQLPRGLM